MMTQAEIQIPLVIFDEFLAAEEWQKLMRYTYLRGNEFNATRVVGSDGAHHVDTSYRRSRVLFELGEFRELFAERIFAFLPRVLEGLDYPSFPISNFEIQLTATNNGEFFRRHNDNGTNSLNSRLITFVYFFYREPKPFTGGELFLFDTDLDDGEYKAPGPYFAITPEQNRILFFVSEYLHEVRPVQCISNDFMDSRFTVNGWLHR
ncbi:MAG TPA: 2OG-Fe(II) oxygenase [Terracidiphilus sp.]|nr:2OG-Fe(II) oxygenase [Terracidiphilus sp.]